MIASRAIIYMLISHVLLLFWESLPQRCRYPAVVPAYPFMKYHQRVAKHQFRFYRSIVISSKGIMEDFGFPGGCHFPSGLKMCTAHDVFGLSCLPYFPARLRNNQEETRNCWIRDTTYFFVSIMHEWYCIIKVKQVYLDMTSTWWSKQLATSEKRMYMIIGCWESTMRTPMDSSVRMNLAQGAL